MSWPAGWGKRLSGTFGKCSSKNAKLGTESKHFGEGEFRGEIKILCILLEIGSVCRTIATFCPVYFSKPRRRCRQATHPLRFSRRPEQSAYPVVYVLRIQNRPTSIGWLRKTSAHLTLPRTSNRLTTSTTLNNTSQQRLHTPATPRGKGRENIIP